MAIKRMAWALAAVAILGYSGRATCETKDAHPDLKYFTPQDTEKIREYVKTTDPKNPPKVAIIDGAMEMAHLITSVLDGLESYQKEQDRKMTMTDRSVRIAEAPNTFDPRSVGVDALFEKLTPAQKKRTVDLALRWYGAQLTPEQRAKINVDSVEKVLQGLSKTEKDKLFAVTYQSEQAALNAAQKKEIHAVARPR